MRNGLSLGCFAKIQRDLLVARLPCIRTDLLTGAAFRWVNPRMRT
jgi:hypothetical protein